MRLPEFIQVAPRYPSRRRTKKQKDIFANQGLCSHSYGFSSSHVRMWELGHKEDWTPKNWCFQIVVLEKTLENPLNIKEIKQSIQKEINPEHWRWSWSSNTSGHLMQKASSAEKTLMPGEIEGRRRGGNRGRDSWTASPTQWSWIWASSSRQWRTERSLVCCKPWGHRESHTTQGVNNKQPIQQGTRVTRRWWTYSSGAGQAYPCHRVPSVHVRNATGTQRSLSQQIFKPLQDNNVSR